MVPRRRDRGVEEAVSQLRTFLKKVSHYVLGNGLGMMAGLISYPILTRVLAPADYGIMGLVSSVLLGAAAFGKLGIQNSLIRFFAEARRQGTLPLLARTYLTAGLAAAGLASLLLASGAWTLGQAGVLGERLAFLLVITSPLALIRTQHSLAVNLLRADERSRTWSTIDVAHRYLSLVFGLVGALYVIGGVEGFFTGLVTAEALILIASLVAASRVVPLRIGGIDPKLLRAAVTFGLPLLFFELTNIVLAFGDRVLILELLDAEALGHYTAAYNLSDTLQKFLMMPIALAVQPMYMRLWADHGEEATKAFLGKAGAFFALVATPAVFGVIAVRAPLLTLLAGEAYSDGIDVIPLAFGGYVIYGSYTVLAAGLFIHRRTGRLAIATACACVVNLGLNLVLIPRMGIVGAAIATAISYIGLMLVLTFMSFRSLRFPLPWGYILRVVGFGAVMFLSITWIDLGHPAATLAARIVLGAFVFCSLALGVDSRGRRLVQEILRPG
jgi:O-antigen/teichoic acid export membrane protein